MKIGILIYLTNDAMCKSFITSFLQHNTVHDYTINVIYDEGDAYVYNDPRVISTKVDDRLGFIQQIDDAFALYDYVVVSADTNFCRRSLDEFFTQLSTLDNDWQLCGNSEENSEPDNDTNMQVSVDEYTYIDCSFAILNSHTCEKGLRELVDTLEIDETSMSILLSIVLNISNNRKIINNLVFFGIYINTIDLANVSVVNFSELPYSTEHCMESYYYLDEYMPYIEIPEILSNAQHFANDIYPKDAAYKSIYWQYYAGYVYADKDIEVCIEQSL